MVLVYVNMSLMIGYGVEWRYGLNNARDMHIG